MTGSYLLIAATAASALLVGLFPRLLEAFRPALMKRLDGEAARLGNIGAWFNFSLLPMTFLGGLFIDNWGPRQVLFLGILLLSTGLAVLAMTRSPRSVRFAVVTLGAAGGLMTTAVTVLMPYAFLGVEYAASSVNLGFVLVGAGLVTAPVMLEAVQRRLGFRNGTLVLALLCLLPALFLAVPQDFPAPATPVGWDELLSDPRLWMLGLIFLLYYPLERSIHTWPTTYLTELEFTPRTIGVLWIGFWGLFLAARLAAAGFLLPYAEEVWVVLVLVLLVAVVHGNLVGVYDRSNASWGFLFLGGCFGPIFPTLLGVTLVLFPEAPGSTIGLLYVIALLGSLLFQPFLHVFACTHRIRATMRLPMILGLLAGVPLLILALIRY